ncbi:hypothetical protein [Francisella frigiditurris]|uniref:Lipoprotein n=1 Tax=Francisella frigiditurris TaxID=1542390 RepID=A0A1J0KVR0_9GAMM|nr:hypothetical protein [Francisella frigiditurris]APC97754.1 hypothetical protein KX01_22 [Francisella frigiditurris]
MRKIKLFILIILSAILLSSCDTKARFDDMKQHWDRMDMESEVESPEIKKHSSNVTDITFSAANNPDQDISLSGDDFEKRYQAMLKFLKDNGYPLVQNYQQKGSAMIVVKPKEQMPDVYYIGINMEQNPRQGVTKYRIVYGGNKYKARELYNNYKKTL